MNERIKELAYQSGARVMFNKQLDKDDLTLEMFAKLLVQDVIDILSNYSCEIIMHNPDDPCIHPITAIKNHFGVK